jgi:hypothetical protein
MSNPYVVLHTGPWKRPVERQLSGQLRTEKTTQTNSTYTTTAGGGPEQTSHSDLRSLITYDVFTIERLSKTPGTVAKPGPKQNGYSRKILLSIYVYQEIPVDRSRWLKYSFLPPFENMRLKHSFLPPFENICDARCKLAKNKADKKLSRQGKSENMCFHFSKHVLSDIRYRKTCDLTSHFVLGVGGGRLTCKNLSGSVAPPVRTVDIR